VFFYFCHAGDPNVVECAYVASSVVPECAWFATRVKIGPSGVEENYGLGDLDAFEKELLGKAVAELIPSIVEGVTFVANKK
jgi:malate dehydrogenase